MSELYCEISEQQLLGILLLNNEKLDEIDERLKPEHFAYEVHEKIFEAIQNLVNKGKEANPLTLKPLLENDSNFKNVKGIEYLINITADVLSQSSAKSYSETIYDYYIRREAFELCKKISLLVQDTSIDTPITDTLATFEKEIQNLQAKGDTENIHSCEVLADDHLEKILKQKEFNGIKSGYNDIDNALNGFKNGTLTILAGRPGMGKTAFALNIANNIANEKNILMFSLEMNEEELLNRMYSNFSKIPISNLEKPHSEDEIKLLLKACEKIKKQKLYFDDTANIPLSSLKNRAKRFKNKFGIDLIIIDHIHLIKNEKKTSTRLEHLTEVSMELKALSKNLDVPVIALSQLSRACEQREDTRPQLADLRESGSIEQDADVVIGLHREEYYLEREQPQPGTKKHQEWLQKMHKAFSKIDVICLKNRQGPTFVKQLIFKKETNIIENLIA